MRNNGSQPRFFVIEDEDAFLNLEQDWNALFARIASPTPFQRFSWGRLCWQRHRTIPGRRLYVAVLEVENRPVVIAPFVANRRFGVFATLTFLDSLTPQYNEILVGGECRSEEYIEMVIAGIRRDWRVLGLRLNWMPEESALAGSRPSLRLVASKTNRALYVDLDRYEGYDHYLHSLSPNLRRDHGRRVRQLREAGSFSHCLASRETAPTLLAWLFAKKRDWVARRFPKSEWLPAPGTEELFTAAAIEGLADRRTWVTALTIDDRPIAVALAYREGDILFSSKSAYDPAWHKMSPCRTLDLLDIEQAFKEGIHRVDMMIGDEFGKERFLGQARHVFSRRVRLARVRV